MRKNHRATCLKCEAIFEKCSNFLFYRIFLRKTGFHFFEKCFKPHWARSLLFGALLLPAATLAADYKVGITATYSGDFAAFGQSLRNGAQLAFKTLAQPDVNITFDVVDDRGSPQEGVLIAQRLCSDEDVVAVLGYTFSSVALAAIPIIDECQLPVIASAVTSPDLSGSSPYFRRNVMTDAEQGRRAGYFAVESFKADKVYILHQQDDYGIGVAQAFQAAIKEQGATIAGVEAYHLGNNNFRTILTKVKAQAPDTVFIGGFYAEAAKILEQAAQIGLDVRFLASDGSLNPQLITLAKGAAEGMVTYGMFYPSVKSESSVDFIEAYRGAYNMDPDAWAALGYDAAGLLTLAISQTQQSGTLTRQTLNEQLAQMKGYTGVTGINEFDGSGDRQGEMLFFRVKDGGFEPL